MAFFAVCDKGNFLPWKKASWDLSASSFIGEPLNSNNTQVQLLSNFSEIVLSNMTQSAIEHYWCELWTEAGEHGCKYLWPVRW